jgi:hypothetical protein
MALTTTSASAASLSRISAGAGRLTLPLRHDDARDRHDRLHRVHDELEQVIRVALAVVEHAQPDPARCDLPLVDRRGGAWRRRLRYYEHDFVCHCHLLIKKSGSQ